jgi:hypothetical protein
MRGIHYLNRSHPPYSCCPWLYGLCTWVCWWLWNWMWCPELMLCSSMPDFYGYSGCTCWSCSLNLVSVKLPVCLM